MSRGTLATGLHTVHPDDLARAKREFDEGIATGRYSSEYRLLLPDGEIRNVRSRAVPFQDGADAPKMIGAEWDVTADVTLTRELERAKTLAETRNAELEAAKARIEHNALHDSLTGLPNRRYLDEILEELRAAFPTASGGWRFSTSISIASSRSTTRLATPPATPCWCMRQMC